RKKMTLMRAERMARAAPAMAHKGRLQPGSDADITVFDLNTVTDRADFKNPKQFSEGIRWLLVNGVPVVRDGHLAADVHPGRPIWGAGRGASAAELKPPHPYLAAEVRPAMKRRMAS